MFEDKHVNKISNKTILEWKTSYFWHTYWHQMTECHKVLATINMEITNLHLTYGESLSNAPISYSPSIDTIYRSKIISFCLFCCWFSWYFSSSKIWECCPLERYSLVTKLKVFALTADPSCPRYHKYATMGASILQMDHYKIFLHRAYGFTKLYKENKNS